MEVYKMKITCCKNCKRRKVGCHDICKDYQAQRKELDKFNEELRLKILAESWAAPTRKTRRK